jgi:hypothetical protein
MVAKKQSNMAAFLKDLFTHFTVDYDSHILPINRHDHHSMLVIPFQSTAMIITQCLTDNTI